MGHPNPASAPPILLVLLEPHLYIFADHRSDQPPDGPGPGDQSAGPEPSHEQPPPLPEPGRRQPPLLTPGTTPGKAGRTLQHGKDRKKLCLIS